MYPTITQSEESGKIICRLCRKPIDVGVRFIRFTDTTATLHKQCEEEMRLCIESGHLHPRE